MPLEEVIRRNRRRIVLVATVAVLNFALVASLVAGVSLWGLVAKFNADIPAGLAVVSSLVLGVVIACAVVASKLRSLRSRLLGRLGAVPIQPGEQPRIDNLLAGLCIAAGLPPVGASLVADDVPNALALGRRPSETTLVLTTGLIERLTRDELEAVLATELCAIRRLDTAMETATLACTSGAVSIHGFWREDGWKNPRAWPMIVATWPSMVLAVLLRRSVLRAGDFGADRMAVAITRNPDALRQALVKLLDDSREALDPGVDRRFQNVRKETAPLWFEPLNDNGTDTVRELRWLRSTASIEERIARLPG